MRLHTYINHIMYYNQVNVNGSDCNKKQQKSNLYSQLKTVGHNIMEETTKLCFGEREKHKSVNWISKTHDTNMSEHTLAGKHTNKNPDEYAFRLQCITL